MSKVGKYILFFIAGLFLLVTALLLYTQTNSFREKVKIQLIKIVEKQLDLDLEIEKIDGNLYSYFTLKNIKFSKGDSTVATFTALQINYKLVQLTTKIIYIDSVIIEDPQINLWQNSDSTWSFNQFIKASEKKATQENKPFNYRIKLGYLSLKNGNISAQSFSKLIPAKTRNFNLIANGSYSTKEQRIQLKKLDFKTEDPSIVLNKLSGIFKRNSKVIQLDSLLLITEGSAANMNGEYVSIENLNTNIEARNVDKNEISLFIPSLKLNCSPSLNANFNTVNDSVSAHVELQFNNESVIAELALNSFSNLLNKTEPIPYFAHLDFDNFNIENWIDIKNNHSLIDGKIKIDGSNLLNFKSSATIIAELNHSEYNQIKFDTLLLNGVFEHESLNANLNLTSDFGDVHISGELQNIFEIPKYEALIESNAFNLTTLVPKLKGTKINGTVLAKGSGFKGENFKAQANLNLIKSSVYNFPIDTLNAFVELQNLQLNIDSLNLFVPGAFIKGGGVLSLDSLTLESLVYAEIDSLNVLDSIIILPLDFESVKTTTTLTGPVAELKIGGDVEIRNAEGYASKLENANAEYLISIKKDSLNVWVNTTASVVETGPAEWDTVHVHFNYSKAEIDLEVNAIWKDTINASVTTKISLGDTMSFIVPNFEVQTFLSNYYLADTMKISVSKKENFEIDNLHLKDYSQPDFILSANGTISTTDTNHLELFIKQLDLNQINRFVPVQDSLKGILQTNISLRGSSSDPNIEGTININNPEYGNYGLTSLIANFNYKNQNGFAEVLIPDLEDAFYTSFNAPFKAYFDSLNFVFSPPDTFNASLVLDDLPISPLLGNLVPNDSISGILNSNLSISGDYRNPLFYGNLDLINGYYQNVNLGLDYNQIQTSVIFEGKKITLDTVLVQQKSGLISVTGEMEFDSTIVKGNIVSSSLTADANNFFITQNRNYEVLIDAKTFVKTDNQNPEFGGEIRVIRSDIYLPALISDEKGNDKNDIPMLVEALYPQNDSLILSMDTETQVSEENKIRKALLDNLTGRLRVEIPRNTWIKSDDMRLELSGEVDIVKSGSYFELFGNIDISRGHYIFYGKKLNIKESQLIFQGGEELDPNLNFVAEYIYRGSDKVKRYLELIVTGKLSQPEIRFLLDENEISETDGISVIIFGATSDEIGYSGQNGIISSMGSNAVASVLSSQLNKTIGAHLNLDMIEITSTENWQSAAFMIGKYITNDIFVMYERGFGEVEGDEITPETITLEYELNKLIFLRLQSGSSTTSGLDVILKFEQNKKE